MALSGLYLFANIFPRFTADDLNFLRQPGAITHHNHPSGTRVLQLVERPAGDERCLSRLEHRFAAIRKTRGALSVDDIKRLVGIMAVHLVFVARLVVVHPAMKTRCVEYVFAFLFVGQNPPNR